MDPSTCPKALFAQYDALTSTIAAMNAKMRPAMLQYLGAAQKAAGAGGVVGKPCPTHIGPVAHCLLLSADSVKQATLSLRRDLDRMRLESDLVVSKRAVLKQTMERMMAEADKVLSCKTCSRADPAGMLPDLTIDAPANQEGPPAKRSKPSTLAASPAVTSKSSSLANPPVPKGSSARELSVAACPAPEHNCESLQQTQARLHSVLADAEKRLKDAQCMAGMVVSCTAVAMSAGTTRLLTRVALHTALMPGWVGESTMSVHQDRVELVMAPLRAAALELDRIKACVRKVELTCQSRQAALEDPKAPCEQPADRLGDV